MKTIIFLDVDGVLNCHDTKERFDGFLGVEERKIKLLRELVDKVNGEVVLSSTWREQEKFLNHLKKRLKKHDLSISDTTPTMEWNLRGDEIKVWLANNPVDRFIILDDEDFRWEEKGLGKHWVCTVDDEWCFSPGLEEKHIEFIVENIERFNAYRENGLMVYVSNPWVGGNLKPTDMEAAEYLRGEFKYIPLKDVPVEERKKLCMKEYGAFVTESFHVVVPEGEI